MKICFGWTKEKLEANELSQELLGHLFEKRFAWIKVARVGQAWYGMVNMIVYGVVQYMVPYH